VLPPGSIHTADVSSCQTVAAGINDTRLQALGYTTTAPTSIGRGIDFTVTVRPDPSSIPLSQQGFTVAGVRQHIYRVGLPAGVTYVSGSGVQGTDDTGHGFSYGTLGDKIITSVLNVGQVSTACYDTKNINSNPPVFGATPMTNITIN
jgi:hypothetical protein